MGAENAAKFTDLSGWRRVGRSIFDEGHGDADETKTGANPIWCEGKIVVQKENPEKPAAGTPGTKVF